jgi:hypothetical protein
MRSNPPINPGNRHTMFRLWALWLLLSLLLSQSLGQLHAVKHSGPGSIAHAASGHEAHGLHHDHKQVEDDFLDLLFSSHGNDADCRLYDHLSAGHGMPLVSAALLPIVLPSVLVAIFAGDALARWATLFDARGPPLTS